MGERWVIVGALAVNIQVDVERRVVSSERMRMDRMDFLLWPKAVFHGGAEVGMTSWLFVSNGSACKVEYSI